MHILPNISRSKSNQTTKFGQFIECNMRNIFLEKSYIKCCGETKKSFLKSQNWGYLWINRSKFYTVCFYVSVKLRVIEILKLSYRPLAFTSLPATFSAQSLKKKLLWLHFINWPNFVVWSLLLREILGNMCIVVVC